MTNENTSLEKYTSHSLLEMVAKGLCVRGELETEKTVIYSPPVPLSLAAFFFSFHWAAQSGVLRAHSPLLGAGSLYSICLQLTDSNSLNFLSHRVISLFDVHLLLVGVISAPNSTRPQSRLYPDIFDRMHLFLDRRLGRRSICYIHILPQGKSPRRNVLRRLEFELTLRPQFNTIYYAGVCVWGGVSSQPSVSFNKNYNIYRAHNQTD